jgi:hypothetical protein
VKAVLVTCSVAIDKQLSTELVVQAPHELRHDLVIPPNDSERPIIHETLFFGHQVGGLVATPVDVQLTIEGHAD